MNKLTFALALLFIFAAGCSAPQPIDLSSYELPASVEVTFNTLIPASTPAGETVQLTILDEVTGLEFNRQAKVVSTSGENSVSITISVPAGTLLQYRYTHLSTSGLVDEVAADGSPVLFRAYLVDGPGHVAYDMVAAWADAPTEQDTGQVSGVVSDAASGKPIAAATVIAGGKQTRTDGEGHFLLTGLPQGLHNVLVYTPSGSHLPFQQGALVAAGSETPAVIQLSPAQRATVTFWMTTPPDHTSSTPVFLAGNLDALANRPLLAQQADGRYSLTMQLPAGVDIRYKYTLGDGLWNAEHLAAGDFVIRQLIIPPGTTTLEIEDNVAAWQAGTTAPIWFELTAPADDLLAYIQFNLGTWSTPLPMWPLGEGHWAYKLYSPTNFATPVEYRYCLDAACTVLEAAPGQPRFIEGNLETLQQREDTIDTWQGE